MSRKFINNLRAEDSLTARTMRSVGFTFLTYGGAQGLRLASNLILTRILFPEAFGLMALVHVVLSGLEMLSVTGVRASIIQHKRGDDERFLNTAWVVQIGRGFFIWVLVLLFAGPIAGFYAQPSLQDLLIVAGFSTVITGFQSTNMANNNRHLLLGRLTFLELFSQLCSIIVMIVLAIITGSVWALIAGRLVNTSVRTALSHIILSGNANRPAWDPSAFRDIFHFGKYIFIGSIAGFLINFGDRLILGKFVSLTELAVYNIGFFLATIPVMLSRRLSSKVLLPLYSKSADTQNAGRRRKEQKARGLLVGGLVLVSLFLALIGDMLIRFLYSPEYHFAGPLMVLIALAYLPAVIISTYNPRLLSTGNSRYQTIFAVFQAVIQTLLLVMTIQSFGLMGAILAPPISALLTYPMLVWFLRHQEGWEPALDAALFGLAFVGLMVVLWFNGSVIEQVLSKAIH